jgi:hypothetical protein
MKRTSIAVCALLAACGGNSGGGGGQCGGGGGVLGGGGGGGGRGPACTVDAPGTGSAAQYQAFTPHTRSLGDASGEFQLALSDGVGAVACGLSTDYHNSLGQAGHEILAYVTHVSGVPCPVGSYSIHSDCAVDPGFMPYVNYYCAYYHAWDAQGKSMGYLPATAGAITVSGNETSCTVQVSLSFSGTQFNDSFTLTNGLDAQPWCNTN